MNISQRSKDWTHGVKQQLLLSHRKPHNEVSVTTVSRWVKEVLKLAGINTELFKAHSVRSASSSKAFVYGLSLSTILNQGNWSRSGTFETYYHKEIVNEFQFTPLGEFNFKQSVLDPSEIYEVKLSDYTSTRSVRRVIGDFTR